MVVGSPVVLLSFLVVLLVGINYCHVLHFFLENYHALNCEHIFKCKQKNLFFVFIPWTKRNIFKCKQKNLFFVFKNMRWIFWNYKIFFLVRTCILDSLLLDIKFVADAFSFVLNFKWVKKNVWYVIFGAQSFIASVV